MHLPTFYDNFTESTTNIEASHHNFEHSVRKIRFLKNTNCTCPKVWASANSSERRMKGAEL